MKVNRDAVLIGGKGQGSAKYTELRDFLLANRGEVVEFTADDFARVNGTAELFVGAMRPYLTRTRQGRLVVRVQPDGGLLARVDDWTPRASYGNRGESK